jgi:hypothetical protein
MLWRREKLFSPARNQTPAIQTIAIPTAIPQLLMSVKGNNI